MYIGEPFPLLNEHSLFLSQFVKAQFQFWRPRIHHATIRRITTAIRGVESD